VLAVSPDATSVVFSDTVDTPQQVFICNSCSSSSRTITSLLISGATAAAFSPDSLKAFIVAGNNLYIYSKVDALQTISFVPSAPASDVAFPGNGMFGYLAGGDAAGGASFPVCFDPSAGAALGSVATPGATMVRALPDGNTILVLAPPDVETVTASIGGSPAPNVPGCPAPRGFFTLANSESPAFNLGQGPFVPTQLMISGDGSTAYILGESPPPNSARLAFIMTFNIANQTSSVISLSGSAIPLSASLSPAGDLLFVGADDGTVHVVGTVLGADLQQISFPIAQSPLCFGPGNPPTVVPRTVIAISAVSQNGSNTTYSYVVNSGPPLTVGETIVIAGMKDGGNDGTYTILSLGAGTFTVTNNSGVTTTSAQNGSGTVPITCNPDLVAVKP
jgi:WD40 repeat protein